MGTSFVEKRLSAWLMRQTSVSSVRKVATVGGAIASELGNVRNDNQDKAVIFQSVDAKGSSYTVAVVADGIGGMQDGAKCAALGVAAFVSEFVQSSKQLSSKIEYRVSRAMLAANEAVYQQFGGRGGTTFVALVASHLSGVFWASAGDSRLYSFSEGKLNQVSIDDTIAGQLGKQGRVSTEHSKILQYVGMGKDFFPNIEKSSAHADQIFLLTTDGVHFLAENSDVLTLILQNCADPGVVARRLVDLAKWCGGPDNATIAILPAIASNTRPSFEDKETLTIWDAFGELQIDIRPMSENSSDSERQFTEAWHQRIDKDSQGQDPRLFETLQSPEPEAKLDKKPIDPTPKVRKSRSRKPKTQEKATPPQLDIKFSSKPE
jgi:PPM family protein phosphatase